MIDFYPTEVEENSPSKPGITNVHIMPSKGINPTEVGKYHLLFPCESQPTKVWEQIWYGSAFGTAPKNRGK